MEPIFLKVEESVDPSELLVDTKSAGLMNRGRIRSNLKKRVTITDVAKACGVTPATVSRVLNRKSKFRVSKEVGEKIHSTAQRLGYFPDLAARNLNRNESHIVGLFASPYTHVAEGINESLLEGIADVLNPSRYDVFFELGAISRRRESLPFWRFDGAILLQSPKAETIIELDQRKVPYVTVNEKTGNPSAAVYADDQMGMQRAVDHLATLGHKRLSYANAPSNYFSHYSVAERHETLVASAKDRNLELVKGHDAPFAVGIDFLKHAVIDYKATAVITYDHNIAVNLVGAAYKMGLRIPQDFSLICFNDVFPVAQLGPAITAVSVSGLDMGRIGARLLLNVLETEEKNLEFREIRVPENLVVRDSTAAPKQ